MMVYDNFIYMYCVNTFIILKIVSSSLPPLDTFEQFIYFVRTTVSGKIRLNLLTLALKLC